MKDNKKNQIMFYVLLFVFIIGVLLVAYYQLKISDKTYSLGYSQTKFDREVKKNFNIDENLTNISKKFVAKKNNLEKIRIKFSLNKEENFKINVKLLDLTNNLEIFNKEITKSDLIDGNIYFLKFDAQKNSKNKMYLISIDVLEKNNSNVSISYIEKNLNDKDTITTMNNQKINNTLEINEYYQNYEKQKIFNIVAFVSTIIAIVLSIFIFLNKNMNEEKAFLFTVPIMCIMFLIIMPMFKSHDEQRHWLRAYEVSEGNIFSQVNDNKVESFLPKNVIDPLNTYWRDITYEKIGKAKDISLDDDNREYTDMSYVAVYSPIQYIPQAIGIGVSRIFTDNILIMAYSARLANLLFSMIIMFLAIKITPILKKAFLLLSMLPLSVEAFSSMSPDAITISIAFLFIAYIFKLIHEKDKKINKKDIAVVVLISMVIALCKIVYIPLVGLLLLLPKDKFNSNKRKWLFIVFVILMSVVMNITWLAVANQYLSLSSEGVSGGQILNILTHPIEYIKIFLYSLNVNGQRYLTSLFGGELGWNEFSLYFFVPYIYCALFLFVSITEKKENNIEIWKKIIILLIVLTIFALIFTSLYVQWTKPEDVSIKGVQGRYFIPFMPLVAILLSELKINNNYKEKNIIKTIAITGIVLQIYILLSIVINHL